jgi:hypothetical protein
MTCPFFKDFTRECVKEYKRVIQVTTFDVCESGNYVECSIYNMITDKVEKCEYTYVCDQDVNFAGVDFERLKYIGNKFCLHGNEGNCAIYKLRKAGKELPKNLSPDGHIMNLKM